MLHYFKIKKFFYTLAFYFTLTTHGFSTSSHLSFMSLPDDVLINIFTLIGIKGARDIDQEYRSLLKVSNGRLWFLHFSTVLHLKNPQAIDLTGPNDLEKLIKVQYKFRGCSSNGKYTAFTLKSSAFSQSDVESLILNFPTLKILKFNKF